MEVVAEGGAIGFGVRSDTGATGVGHGYVTFNGAPSTTAVLNLTAQSDNGWPVSIAPQTVTVNGPGRIYYTVTADAPPAAPAGPAGNLRVDARVRINNFACTAPEPASFPLQVATYVDVFGARIVAPAEPTEVGDIPRSFDIEVQVRSNSAMRVRLTYTSSENWYIQGPSALDVEPTYSLVATGAAHIEVSGARLTPGFTTIDILVEGEVGAYTAGETPYVGRLGYVVYVNEPEGGPVRITNPFIPLALGAAGAAAVAAVSLRFVAARRRAAVVRLREVLRERRFDGRPPGQPPRG